MSGAIFHVQAGNTGDTLYVHSIFPFYSRTCCAVMEWGQAASNYRRAVPGLVSLATEPGTADWAEAFLERLQDCSPAAIHVMYDQEYGPMDVYLFRPMEKLVADGHIIEDHVNNMQYAPRLSAFVLNPNSGNRVRYLSLERVDGEEDWNREHYDEDDDY